MVSAHDPSSLGSERAELLRSAILESLAYRSMNDRETQIVSSHTNTFDWIFGDLNHKFVKFLKGNENLYWVTGLPGSGKSTLMRYIHEDKRLRKHLSEWSQGKGIAMGSFFFWESGTQIQRSQEGFLRSVLYQLLESHETLIPSIFPKLWEKIWDSSTLERVRTLASWSPNALANGLSTFFEVYRGRVFLMIDGLDEFEGDHKVTLDLISRLRTKGFVKICISSRPWDVFQTAFSSEPSLRLQDYTTDDMTRVAMDKLSRGSLKGLDQQDSVLIDRMVEKAAGVFLWISLACQWLNRMVVDSQENLLFELDKLPSSLNDLYWLMVFEVAEDPTVPSKIFQLLQCRQSVADFTGRDDLSMTLWELCLAEQIELSDAIEMNITTPSREDVKGLCDETMEDLTITTAGLVEVQKRDTERQASHTLVYIHRTVKDWLAESSVWSKITALTPSFSGDLENLKAVVLSFKYPSAKIRKARTIPDWWPLIVLALSHARYVSPVHSDDTCALLDEFDAALSHYYPSMNADPRLDSWSRTCYGSYEERGHAAYEAPFLGLCVKFGVREYVKQVTGSRKLEFGDGHSPLAWSTMYMLDRQNSLYPLSDPVIVRMLLEYGMDPNKKPTTGKIHAASPWQVALQAVQQGDRRGWIRPDNETRLHDIMKAFLEHSADEGVLVKYSHKDEKEIARDLLKRLNKT